MRRIVSLCVVVLFALAAVLEPLPSAASGPTRVAAPAAADQLNLASSVDLQAGLALLGEIRSNIDTEIGITGSNLDETNSASNVRLTVALPAGATFVQAYNNDGAVVPSSNTAGLLTFTFGAVAPQHAASFVMVIHLPTLPPGVALSMQAGVQSTNPDPDSANNTATFDFTSPTANLSLSLYAADDSGAPVAGHQTTIALGFNNEGQLSASQSLCTVDLAPGLTLHTATLLHNGQASAIQPVISGNRLTFNLGTVDADTFAEIHLLLDVAASVHNGETLFNSAAISTPDIELKYDDNYAQYTLRALKDAPDLWVQMSGQSGEEIDSPVQYVIDYGNSGVQPAPNAELQLALPSLIGNYSFDPAPTTIAGNVARWNFGALPPSSSIAGEIWVLGKVMATGVATATATIASSAEDGYPDDNVAVVGMALVGIRPPTLGGPILAVISPTPAVFGLGEPGAMVSVWVSDTVSVRDLGTTTVDADGTWVYTVTQPLRANEWAWLVVDQELGDYLSQPMAAPSFVTTTMGIDPNSLTRGGARWGGLEQPLFWSVHNDYRIGMRITACAAPTQPSLRADFYNDADQLINSLALPPVAMGPNGYVAFDFQPPAGPSFALTAEWNCPGVGALEMGAVPGKGSTPIAGGGWQKTGPGKWEKIPPKPKPRPKPKQPNPLPPKVPTDELVELAPLVPLEPPKPKAIDPDGYVYDAALVTGGAPMAQALVANAWVTATHEMAPDVWAPWDAAAWSQVNPQYTDTAYADKVLKKGYYAFFVPPGNYRVQVRAPGYAPYLTEILSVIAYPITRHIGLIPLGGRARYSEPQALQGRLFLPVIQKR